MTFVEGSASVGISATEIVATAILFAARRRLGGGRSSALFRRRNLHCGWLDEQHAPPGGALLAAEASRRGRGVGMRAA